MSEMKEEKSLTPAQVRILQCLADGMSAKEVAFEMHVKVRTVNFHLYNAYERLHSNNGKHAIAIAFRRGLLR